MNKRKSSNICPHGKIGLIRLPVTQEIASSSLAGGAQIIMKGVIGMKRKHDEKEIKSNKFISAGDAMVA